MAMKILCIVLLVIGGTVNFLSDRICTVLFGKDYSDGRKIMIKSMGLAIVFAAAIIAFIS